jgi:hypothetical protein
MQQKKTQVHLHSTAIYQKTPATTSNLSHNQETPIGASANVTSVMTHLWNTVLATEYSYARLPKILRVSYILVKALLRNLL